MTKLPENANELVAKACELKLERGRGKWVDDVTSSPFHPDTDPAAALKAADAYAALRDCDLELYVDREKDGALLYWCKFENVMECRGPTRCHAICRAIIEAEKARKR